MNATVIKIIICQKVSYFLGRNLSLYLRFGTNYIFFELDGTILCLFFVKNYKNSVTMHRYIVWDLVDFKICWTSHRKFIKKVTDNYILYLTVFSLQYIAYRSFDLHFYFVLKWLVQKWMLVVPTSLFLYKIVCVCLWRYDRRWNSCAMYFRSSCYITYNKQF